MSIPSPGASPGSPIALTPATLPEFLLAVAPVRPVYIKGPPGIGKSSLVTDFAAAVGLDCVTLLGSQMLPEDLLGVPRIEDGRTRFLIADAAWSSGAVRDNVPPPRLTTALLGETGPWRDTLTALHRLWDRNPELLVTPSHCGEIEVETPLGRG